MSLKNFSAMAAWIIAGAVAIPSGAQQGPAPSPNQPGANVQQPQVPGDPNVPPGPRPPILPRRIPAPVQAQGQPAPGSPPPQPQSGVPIPQPVPVQPGTVDPGSPAPQPLPTVPAPAVRRGGSAPSFPAGGMVSLNFNRADLVEIIHIIAQQLRLTYTIDPEVKGTVTINSAEPLRSEDLMPIFHQILRMNNAAAVRMGNMYHITQLKDGKGLARPLAQGREDS